MGAPTAVGIAEANQSGLSWSRGRRRYLGDILATAAIVTNEFCLGETQRTTNVYLKSYIKFFINFFTELLLHFGDFLVTVYLHNTTRALDQCGHRTIKKSEIIFGHLMLTTATTLCCLSRSKMKMKPHPLKQ